MTSQHDDIKTSGRESTALLTMDAELFIATLLEDNALDNSELSPKTIECLKTLNNYLDCRDQMDNKYVEVDELQLIAKFETLTDSGGIETDSDDPSEYKAEYQQQSIEGTPVETLNELFASAAIAKPIYEREITRLVAAVCEARGEKMENVEVVFPDLKGRKRALEKTDDDYSNRKPGPGIAWLYDIVRGSVKFNCRFQIAKFLELCKEDPNVYIVKAKNRFTNPTLPGYRDLNLHIRINCEGFTHICEIQIHHKSIYVLDKALGTHRYYEYFRKYFAGATGSLEERLNDLRMIGNGAEAWDTSHLQQLLDANDLDETRLDRLGKVFREHLCEYNWALRTCSRLLMLRVELYGEDHPTVADTYRDMAASALFIRPTFCTALNRRALEIYKKTIGENNLFVASLYNDLGRASWLANNADESYLCFKKALESVRGKDILLAGKTLTSIGTLSRVQGRLDEAMSYVQEALAVYERILGSEDIEVGRAYRCMGTILRDQGKLDDAIATLKRAAEVFKMTSGPDHFHVGDAYDNIGQVLRDQGKLEESLSMHRKSMEISKKVFGEGHMFLAWDYCNIGDVLWELGDFEEAVEFSSKSLTICDQQVDDSHALPKTLAKANRTMAKALQKDHKLDEALKKLELSLEKYGGIKGKTHLIDLARTYNALSSVLDELGRKQEAIEMEAKANAITNTPENDFIECWLTAFRIPMLPHCVSKPKSLLQTTRTSV